MTSKSTTAVIVSYRPKVSQKRFNTTHIQLRLSSLSRPHPDDEYYQQKNKMDDCRIFIYHLVGQDDLHAAEEWIMEALEHPTEWSLGQESLRAVLGVFRGNMQLVVCAFACLKHLSFSAFVHMSHARRMTIIERDVLDALRLAGFVLPDLDGMVPELNPKVFSNVWQRWSNCILPINPRISDEAAWVLQVVFESLGPTSQTVSTPSNGGKMIQLESPTGVRAAIFRADWTTRG